MSSDDARRSAETATDRLQHVLELARGVNSSRGLADLLGACFRGLAAALHYDEAYLALEEGDAFRAFFVARTGSPDEFVMHETVFDRNDAPLTRRVLELGRPLLLGDATDPKTAEEYPSRVYSHNPDEPVSMRGMMVVPVRAAPLTGVLSVQSRLPNVYDATDLEHLTTLAELICVALKRVRWDEHEAILQALGRLGHHAADPERFFQSLLECTLSAFNATAGEVWELCDAGFVRRAGHGATLLAGGGADPLLQALALDGEPRELHDPGEMDPALRDALQAAELGFLLALPVTAAGFRGLVLLASSRRFTQWDIDRAAFLRRELVPYANNLMLYRKLAEEAIRDPLTGAFNRRYFIMKAEEALSHAARYGHTVALLVVDLQRFSDVNDEFGHKTGDRVLALVANAFTQSLRASDTFFRIGGDEFVMLLPQADTDAAKRAAERCAAALPAEPELARYSVRANVGWAVYPADGATVDDLLETGDRRMYVAKTAGEDVYDPAQE